LKGAPDDKLLRVFDDADTDGRSRPYVERLRQVEATYAFFARQDAAKPEAPAEPEPPPPEPKGKKAPGAAPAPEPAAPSQQPVDTMRKCAVRERSEAQRTIERFKGVFGAERVPILQKQADAVSYASYLVTIGLVESKVRLRTMLAEVEEVKQTARRYQETERV